MTPLECSQAIRTIYIYMYTYVCMYAYLLGKRLLKTGEKVHFSTKKSTTDFGHPFCSFPLPFFASKWPKYPVSAFQEGKKVGRQWALQYIYIYVCVYIYICCEVYISIVYIFMATPRNSGPQNGIFYAKHRGEMVFLLLFPYALWPT